MILNRPILYKARYKTRGIALFYTYDYCSQNWLRLKQEVYQPLFIPFSNTKKMGWCSVHKKWETCVKTKKGNLYFMCGQKILAGFATVNQWTISSVETTVDELRELVRLKVNLVYTYLQGKEKRYLYEYKTFAFYMKTGAVVSYESCEGVKRVNVKLPVSITKDIQAKLQSFSNKIFGIAYKNSSPKSGIDSLTDYVVCPACPQVADLKHFLGNAFDRVVDRKSKNPYEDVCNYIHVKPFKRMRRIFDKNPLGLPIYSVLKTWGFSDVNVMTKFLEDVELCNTYFKNIQYDWHTKRIVTKDENFMGSLFYAINDNAKDIITVVGRWTSESLKLQNEKITMNHLIKAMKDGYHNFFDAAQMYYSRAAAIPEALKNRIQRECFTNEVHDALVQVFPDTFGFFKTDRSNKEIPYVEADKKLEASISVYNGVSFDFVLPKDTDELYTLGERMHNCVGWCYREKALNRSSIIVGVKYVQNGQEANIACIEINTKYMAIVQAKGVCNSRIRLDFQPVIIKWAMERNLQIHTHDLYSSRGMFV